ncbi:hypothetical protein QYE76_068335 [Lolium multiflorum]|uniref:Reverse transcriptase domain-containing protein n=1 Tax=Lolium multiflorum TaxID=4521 RepID=A0AAD8SEB7_LOLMU|nr:hypothetical protein QYE76_068335 [Lolium multiflorum]
MMINGESLTALVDTGSTHNFLSGDAMRRLPQQPSEAEKFIVTFANGDPLDCQDVARQVPILIGNEHFSIDCVDINLGCYYFILGVDFLSTLGPILWDFDALTLIFWCEGGRRVQWAGIGSTGPVTPQLQLMAATLDEAHPSWPTSSSRTATSSTSHMAYRRCAPVTTTSTCCWIRRMSPCAGTATPNCRRTSSSVRLTARGVSASTIAPLNARTSKDKFPIPVMEELLDELHGARFFTKLGLRSGYHHVRMHPDDIVKTAFRTHHGHFEFLVMPFGLSNALTTFQALMNDVLSPYLRRFVLLFFDDILIYNSSWVEHLQHVAIIFNELRAHRLHLKRSKCSFGTTSVAYLGHVTSAEGVAMDADKVATVAAWPTPQSPRALRGFLALAGYYWKYIRDFGLIAAPLTHLLRRGAFSWDAEETEVFQALQQVLTTGPVLQMSDFDRSFVVDCNASDIGFGVVLHQGEGPLAFVRCSSSQARGVRVRAHRVGPGRAPLATLSLGADFLCCTDHYSLKFLLN